MKITSDSIQKDRKGSGSGKRETALDGASASPDGGSASQGIDRSQLDEMIAVAAYFRAEQRGFTPGDELNDWFQAEAEYLYQSDTTGKGS